MEHKVECGTFGCDATVYKRVRKIITEHFDVDISVRTVQRRGTDDERAAALISSVPREELLDSLCWETAAKLNRLIQEHKVECGTFGQGQHDAVYKRVRKIISEHFEVDIFGSDG